MISPDIGVQSKYVCVGPKNKLITFKILSADHQATNSKSVKPQSLQKIHTLSKMLVDRIGTLTGNLMCELWTWAMLSWENKMTIYMLIVWKEIRKLH